MAPEPTSRRRVSLPAQELPTERDREKHDRNAFAHHDSAPAEKQSERIQGERDQLRSGHPTNVHNLTSIAEYSVDVHREEEAGRVADRLQGLQNLEREGV